jgi:hypothetical protein
MHRMKSVLPLALALVLLSCGKDVVIDVDTLPAGNAQGDAATGTFDYNEVVTRSNCPASIAGHTIPAETTTWSSTVNVTQEEGLLRLEFPASDRDPFTLDGGIYWHGNFRVGGTYWYVRDTISFINLVDGRFTEGVDDFEGWTTVRVQGGGEDCEMRVDFTGTRR